MMDRFGVDAIWLISWVIGQGGGLSKSQSPFPSRQQLFGGIGGLAQYSVLSEVSFLEC
jgi:hypothetical protein